MTDEELAMLTDEERAGLDEDHGDEIDDETEDDADDEGSDAGDADGGNGADDDNAGGSDDQHAGRDDGSDEANGADADEQEAEEGDRPLPLLKVDAVEDAEAKLADIDKREDDLSQKFEDGDLTTAEYRAELRKLERERGAIERQQLEADFAEKHNQAQIDAMWQANVQTFLDSHPEVSKNELRWNAFDLVVRQVTSETMQAGKNPGMADLKKAYARWAEDLGIESAPPKPKADEAKKDGQQPAKAQKAPKQQRELPPTLARVPASDISDTDDGKWASLDRLMETNPVEYEKAFSRLSEVEQEAYLASQ